MLRVRVLQDAQTIYRMYLLYQELLSSFTLKNSLRSLFSLSPQGLCLVIFNPSSSGFWYFFFFFYACFIPVHLLAGTISPEIFFVISSSILNGNVTCPSLFVAKFKDEEEDRTCFLKINGPHITVKPID